MADADKYVKAFAPFLVGSQQSNGEWRAFCPIHEDPSRSKSSSAMINFKFGVWNCNSAKCGEHGTVKQLHRALQNGGRVGKGKGGDVIDIKSRKKVDDEQPEKPMASEADIRQWTKVLLSKPNAYNYISGERGLTKPIIRKFQVGWDGQRYTIPIRDEAGELVNIRRYKPRAQMKMISWGPGWGSGRMFGWDVIQDDQLEDVVLCEGELDMLVGRVHDIPTFTHTSGSAVWKPEWTEHLKGKRVYIAYDEDPAGNKGAVKVAAALKNVAKGVYRVKLGTNIKGGDVTDFFVKLGNSRDEFLVAMKDAEVLWEDEGEHVVPATGKHVSVEESQSVDHKGPIELTVMVAGKVTPPFIAPKTMEATCNLGAPDNVCATCPLAVAEGRKVIEVSPDDDRLLNYVEASDKRKHEMGRALTGAKCSKHVDFIFKEQYSIEELVVQPSIEHRTEDTETPISRKVFNVGTYKTPVNQLARIVGRQVPDPRNQRGTILGWHLEAINSDIDNFTMTPQMRRRLARLFQPKEGQSVMDKCEAIARDISKHVTHIYGRDLMHVAYDLVWHSTITFDFMGQSLTKGWLECLIMGDTRTGKSEAANRLRQHYRSGILRSCEGASLAGLVGGASKAGGKDQWMVTWGVLPLNDRRLVVLDEMSGLMNNRESKGIIESMSSIRSEGKAEITKIVNEETSARTRLIWISNPMDGSRLSDYDGSALRALTNMVKNPEDIARYDFVMAVANNEVDSSVINSYHNRDTKSRYGSEDCAALVMWAWSRRSDQIRWSPAAEQAVLRAAADLGERYVPHPPLIQAENVRVKLARLAVAFAARTFSTDKTGELLRVRTQHVKAAVEFLDAVYSTDAMGYTQHSRRINKDNEIAMGNISQCRKFLKEAPEVLHVLRGVGATTFRNRDFEEQGALDREEAKEAVKKLTTMKMIERGAQGRLRIRPALAKLLKEMGDD